MCVLQDITFGSTENYFDILRLFLNKVQFTVDLKTNNCSRVSLNRPWRDFGQVEGAQNIGEAYIGSSGISGAGVHVTLWSVFTLFSLFILNPYTYLELFLYLLIGLAMRHLQTIELLFIDSPEHTKDAFQFLILQLTQRME